MNETIARKMPYQDNVTVAILGYALPPPVPLSDTVLRKEPPLQQELPPLKTGEPVRAKSSAAKWGVIVLLLLVLAIAGFFGGQYFGGDL